jgi:CelD/BcsL family acetyltransferase involved in cellulose biosynthesis
MSGFVVAREDDFDFRSPEYAALYAGSEATLFQHPTWLDQIYRHRAPATGSTRVVVTVRERSGGRLVAVLPLIRRRRRGVRFIAFADLGVSDYASAVIDRGSADQVRADAGIPVRVRAALGRFDVLDVQKLKGSDQHTPWLLGQARMRRLPYDTHPISLPPATEDWRQKVLDASLVRRLARQRKRLRAKGEYAVRTVTDPHEVQEALDTIRSFRAARFAGRRAVDLMQDQNCFGFYSAVALQSAAEDGPAVLTAITVGGDLAAATLDLADDGEHLFLIVGYDFERLRSYSLGLLIVDDLIDRAVTHGRHTFDLTVGDEAYKADFGALAVPMYAVRVPVTLRGRVAGWAIDLEAGARRLAKRGHAIASTRVERWRRRHQN